MPLRVVLIGFVAVSLAVVSAAQPPFQQSDTSAQFRDAVVDVASGRVFVAVQDRNEVWVYDPASWERLAQVPVGRGPSALAIDSGNQYLACVNRLDDSVSLIRLADLEAYTTLTTEKGPVSIAATSDGRFAVANMFSDSLSLIDPRGSGAALTIPDVAPVPVAVAANKGFLAVASRLDNALYLYPYGASNATGVVSLGEAAVAVEALPDNRFAVLTGSGLSLVDCQAMAVSTTRAVEGRSMTMDGDVLYVLGNGELHRFDSALKPVDNTPLTGAAAGLAAGGGVVVALDPAGRTWQVRNEASLQVREAAAPAPESSEPAVAIVEAVPVEETKEKDEPAAPVEEPEHSTTEPEEAALASVEEAASTEEHGTAEESEASTETAVELPAAEENPPTQQTGTAPKGHYREHPIHTTAVRAPTPRSRPAASPLDPLKRRSITDALMHPTEFGTPGAGFEAPDWTEPLKNVKAGHASAKDDRTVLEGDVRLRLGNMYFEADRFEYDQEAGYYHALGNVHVTQELSDFTAGEVRYQVPPEIDVPPPSILEPELTDQEQARRRLSLGNFEASDVLISEPARELQAGRTTYDFATGQGELTDVRGRADVFYYSAGKIVLKGPGTLDAEDLWVTTCDAENPHYKLRLKKLSVEEGQAVGGTNAQLMLWDTPTVLWLPKWRRGGQGDYPWTVDFDSGRRAELGYYLNVGQRFEMSPDWTLGPRIYPTEKEGVGLGADLDYDLTKNPASRLYRSQGRAHGLYTTKDRGYLHWYHRWELNDDLVLRMQAEQWGDKDFYKDFYYDQYRNRTTPRTFANVTYRQPGYIATGTARLNTHAWVYETERTPEATFHLLERPLGANFHITYDAVAGYYDREPRGSYGGRAVNVARLTYDWDPFQALSVTPFVEIEGTWYSDDRRGDESSTRFSQTTGVTLQTRFQRAYGGALGFSGFKHVVVPSLTYSYRPEATMDIESVPRFDALDNVYGRSRIETKIDNILYGRDAESEDVWQVGRLSLYQGNDFWNEFRTSEDYEAEIDIRPRPWWGFQLAAERHVISKDVDLDTPFFIERQFLEWYERVFNRPFNADREDEFNATYGDFNRVLTQVYYDETPIDGRLSGRLGFAYTETQSEVFNREILYGLGYKLGDKWGIAFEHRYDFEGDELRTQTYELRRVFHCLEAGLRFRDRESGFDIDFEISIAAFPGTGLKF